MSTSFIRVLLITVMLQASVYALRPMVSYKALAIGANTVDLGIIASAFAALSLVLGVSVGRWIDRWSETRFVTAGAAIIAAVSLCLVWSGSVWILVASQALLGLGHIFSVVATQTLVANDGLASRREHRFGVFTVAVSLGQLLGPALAGLIAGGAGGIDQGVAQEIDTDRVFMSAAAVSLAATLFAVTLAGHRKGSATNEQVGMQKDGPTAQLSYRASIAHVLRIRSMPHAMYVSLTVITAIDILSAYLPAYGESNGISVETVGLLLAARAAASMASRVLMVPLLRLLKLPHLLALSTLLPALSLAFFPFFSAEPVLYAAMVVAGFGLGLGQPVTLSWVAGRAPRSMRGTALGIRMTGNRLGQTVLPAAIGALTGIAGLTSVFVMLAGLLGISTVAVLMADFSDREPLE